MSVEEIPCEGGAHCMLSSRQGGPFPCGITHRAAALGLPAIAPAHGVRRVAAAREWRAARSSVIPAARPLDARGALRR